MSYLTKHSYTHTGDRLYKCDFCSKSFSIKIPLTTHSYTDAGEITFKCDICSKSFSKKIKSDHTFIYSQKLKPI